MKIMDILFLILGIIIFPGIIKTQTTDLTLEPKATGEDVVLASYSKIKSILSADDHRFLIRIAYVESKFGSDVKTFRNDYYGGIWQVGNSTFYTTQNLINYPGLGTKYKQIQKEFNINWMIVKWKDLIKPFYSLLGTYLKLFTLGLRIPQSVEDQARFWKNHYTSDKILRNRLEFINSIRELEDCSTSKIKCRIDLVIVLDGSGSIGIREFDKAKSFVHELIDCIPYETTTTGLIIFSEEIDTIFNLENNLSRQQQNSKIHSANYPGLGTNTHLGMKMATEWLEIRQEKNYNEGIASVMIVLTDGHSSHSSETRSAAIYAEKLGISTFAIGVGPHIHRKELNRIAGTSNNEKVMQINSYKTLSDLLGQIQIAVCGTAKKLKREIMIKENIRQNEVSYYAYQVPQNGITVSIENPIGKTNGFYSYTLKTPSHAYNDGTISEGFNYIPSPFRGRNRIKRDRESSIPSIRHWHHYINTVGNGSYYQYPKVHPFHGRQEEDEKRRQVYIAIEGIQSNNNFTIEVDENLKEMVTTMTTTTSTPSTKPTTEISVLTATMVVTDSEQQNDSVDVDQLPHKEIPMIYKDLANDVHHQKIVPQVSIKSKSSTSVKTQFCNISFLSFSIGIIYFGGFFICK